MNDRFKFRGKRLDNNEWYYGSYLYLHNAPKYDWNGTKHETKEDIHFIIDANDVNYAVNPETIGQSTGLKDKNGKLLYEGDIVNQIYEDKTTYKCEVVYNNCSFQLKHIEDKNKNYINTPMYCYAINYLGHYTEKRLEVIGNIYENKELLEEE